MKKNWTCSNNRISNNCTKIFVMNFFETNQVINCKADDNEPRLSNDIGVWKIKSLKPTKN